MTTTITREHCAALDAVDPLAALRDEFTLPEGLIYLDGNSLGALPRATPSRIAEVVQREWGRGLIGSWNTAGWIDLAARIGDRIAPLIGAGSGEVGVGDSTSVNLYKVLKAAVALGAAHSPGRRTIVSERDNFPTDLYIAQSVAREHGLELALVDEPSEIDSCLNGRLAILMLTHVHYRTGRVHDMAALTAAAHAAGGFAVWDLAHSAGALPVGLTAADADFAVGCGYKYLNGGPGAPAFVWAHPRHTARMDHEHIAQPLAGWLGHAAPFAFVPAYDPAAGIGRFTCGTPPVVSMAALECGVDVFATAEAFGGLAALRQKSLTLSSLFIDLVESRCDGLGLTLVTPREPEMRGSQASFAHAGGHAVMQALIARGIVGDFRAGAAGSAAASSGAPTDPRHADLLRFGFTPLYTRHVDVWDAVEGVNAVLTSGEWREPRFQTRAAVT